MLNQAALESLYSATYLEDYLDCVENLPDDIQRQISKMMEIDVNYQSLMRELETNMSYLLNDKDDDSEASSDEKTKKKMYSRIQQILIKTQELGDEKLQIGQQVQDLVDNKARQLDLDKKNLDFGKEQDTFDSIRETKASETSERSIKRARRARHEVFVPSILGPSTLEATSFSEAPNEQLTSHHTSSSRVSFSHTSSSATTASASASSSSAIGNSSSNAGGSHTTNLSQASGNGSNSGSNSAGAAATSSGTGNSTNNASSNRESGTYSSTPKKSQKQNQEKKHKKRKSTKQNDASPPNIPIDPDEPLYCLCDQVSYGEMIGCDNDLCPIEWFHFSCVSLSTKPKGKWYCPKCRGDRPNIMKPKAIFLKELEKYNREKEEKA